MSALTGKVALVTGASRGVGKQVALALARAGADVIACSTRAGGMDSTVREIEALGRKAAAAAVDLGTPEGVAELAALAERTFGRVDVLVNNAAIAPRKNVVDESPESFLTTFERVMAVNLRAPAALCRAVLPGMIARGFGRIVNISSISGTLGTAGFGAYCASKWGLNGFTKALAEEVRGSNVFVAAVLPGTVRTDLSKDLPFPPAMEALDVAELVRYLCADAPAAMLGSLVEMFG